MPRRLAACLALASALLAAVPAGGAERRSRELWATINICDTAAHPNQMGVRARMPGNGTSQRMYMRFRSHYFGEDGIWHNVPDRSAISRWIRLGHARVRSRETGYTFSFAAPEPGARYVVRGVVEYQWRRRLRSGRERVVRRERLNTRTRSAPVRGADPPGYSNGVCEIR